MPVKIDGTGYIGTANNIYTDGSGRVGIGTSAPAVPLHISHTSVPARFETNTSYNYLQFANTSTPEVGWFGYGSSDQNIFGVWNNRPGDMRFATTGTERLRIDSSGRVTMPYQPCFHVYNNTAGGGHMNDVNGVILWNTVVFNVGGHYSTSTGRFTAPVGGKYMFNIRHLHNGANGYGAVAMYIRKNGSNYPAGQLLFHSYPTWTMASNVVLVELNASDYVDINVTDGTWHDFHNEFSGFLIG